jgi:hypothetical protein
VILLLLYAVYTSGSKEKEIHDDFVTLRAFHQSLLNFQSYNPTNAIEQLHKLQDKSLLDISLSGNIPILHHLLNLYFQASSLKTNQPASSVRASLVEIMLLCIDYGVDVDQSYRNDPSALSKAIILRELEVAKRISSSSVIKQQAQSLELTATESTNPAKNSATVMMQLYAIPCEAVPLAKLLLHADTIIRQNYASKPHEVDLHWIINLLTNAAPGAGSKPSTKIIDLIRESATFNASILSHLGRGSKYQGISLSSIMQSLDENTAGTHKNLVMTLPKLGDEGWNIFCSYKDQGKRNVFHHLAIAGAVTMTRDFTEAIRHNVALSHPTRHRNLYRALMEDRDAREMLAYKYTIIRHGVNSTAFRAMQDLYKIAGVDLEAKDYRIKPQLNVCIDKDACQVPAIPSTTNSGGWDPTLMSLSAEKGQLESARCGIEERWDGVLPTSEEFFENYVKTSTPVVFRQVLRSSDAIMQRFEKNAFLARYGNDPTPIAKIPYAASFGMKASMTTLGHVANETSIDILSPSYQNAGESYAFSVPHSSWREKLQKDIPIPSILHSLILNDKKIVISEDLGTLETQFYLGASGTGAPVHFHGHAVNSLAYGEKKWTLFPPQDAFYSTIPAAEFVLRDPHVKEGTTCTQYGGDLMFVPALWGHGTLNMKQSIGVAHEFSVESFCSE